MMTLHKYLLDPPVLDVRIQDYGTSGLAVVAMDSVTFTATNPDHLDAVATAFMAAAVDLRAYQASPDKPESALAAGAAVALG